MSKTGLVMEGGAMRGLFTCGVIDVLMENNITFDGAVGTSAGAAFGCNLKSGQIGRPLRYNKRFCNDKRYCSIKSLVTTGDMYNVDFCYDRIPFELDPFDTDAFEKNPMEFYVTATDIDTGRCVYHRCRSGKGMDTLWIRASASMPIVSNPVEIKGRLFLDGGMSDSIPVRFMDHMGYEKTVVILTQPEDFVKEPNKLLPIMKAMYYDHKGLVKQMESRHERYNETTAYIKEMEDAGRYLVIRPEESLGIGSAEKDPDELDRVYRIGRTVMEKNLPLLKEFLAKQ